MSERRALILLMIAMMALTAGLYYGLSALAANDNVMFLGFFVPLALGAHLSSRIVMRYDRRH